MSLKNWSLVKSSPVYDSICNEWTEMISDESLDEEDYHAYLAAHAGFFFPGQYGWDEQIVISKLRMGSDHVTDFVVAKGERSYGFGYTLIEIESPHDKVYTKSGNPSAKLNTAIQQVQDWKKWIRKNREQAKRIFPSKQFNLYDDPNFSFIVVIGNRSIHTNNEVKRNQFANNLGIKVRSFNYLSDLVHKRKFHPFTWISRDVFPKISARNNNRFSNPFFEAYTDTEWRNIIESGIDIKHMVAENLEEIMDKRRCNIERLKKFLYYLEGLSDEEKKIRDHQYSILESM